MLTLKMFKPSLFIVKDINNIIVINFFVKHDFIVKTAKEFSLSSVVLDLK